MDFQENILLKKYYMSLDALNQDIAKKWVGVVSWISLMPTYTKLWIEWQGTIKHDTHQKIVMVLLMVIPYLENQEIYQLTSNITQI